MPHGVPDPQNSPAKGSSNTYSADWETEAPGHTASVQEPKYHPRLSRILALSVSSKRKRAMSWGRGSQGGPKAARFCSLVGRPSLGGPPSLLSPGTGRCQGFLPLLDLPQSGGAMYRWLWWQGARGRGVYPAGKS